MGLRVVRGSTPSLFRLEGDLDLSTVAEAEAALFPTDSDDVVTLDLSRLTFMGSTGIHLIIRLVQSCRGVRLLSPSPIVRKVLHVSGLDGTPRVEVADGYPCD
jgi:anti-anti-sigma factor